MNLTRLIVLGLLASHGPSHGHQLRREAELAQAEKWAGIGAGSLHRELRRLEAEQLVDAVTTERVGNRPQRTVYRINAEGHRELELLRAQAFDLTVAVAPDPVSVALVFAAGGAAREIDALVRRRAQAVQAETDRLAAERERGEEQGFLLDPYQAAAFRRAELRTAAEQAWQTDWAASREAATQTNAAASRKAARQRP